MTDLKTQLKQYLQRQRDAILAKVDGLPERELRMPRTPTGTNLLGIVKHCLNVEYGYFGPTFYRRLEDPSGLVPDHVYDIDPQADWYATDSETAEGIVALYRRVQAFCDETIDGLQLDSAGVVAWWGKADVTLGQIMVHVINDLARHAGHADILREQIDGAVGFWGADNNVPSNYDWAAYTQKLTDLARRY